ncbi:MAG: sulfatase-like hydrolase/transferase [Pirellulales bacterium]
MNAIALVIDGWHAGYLGCYGNSWIDTPGVDALAAEGHVFDQATIHSPRFEDIYRAYWQGGPDSLQLRLRLGGVATALVTDCPLVAGLPVAAEFDEVIRLDGVVRQSTAHDLAETGLASLLATSAEWMETARQPFLLWIHARGLAAPWDAPLDFRARYADDDSVAPKTDAQVPNLLLPSGFDPDALLPMRWAYAGQVAMFDECLGGFVDILRGSGLLDETLLAVVGARGFPLGEHRRVGLSDTVEAAIGPIASPLLLYEELIHVPWLLRLPHDTLAPARSQALVQPADLGATLLDAFGCAADKAAGHSLLVLARDEQDELRDRVACMGQGGECSLRTRRWRLHWQEPVDGQPATPPQLFVKPDDRWEVNDVANRCPHVIDPLLQAFQDRNIESPAPLLDIVTQPAE